MSDSEISWLKTLSWLPISLRVKATTLKMIYKQLCLLSSCYYLFDFIFCYSVSSFWSSHSGQLAGLQSCQASSYLSALHVLVFLECCVISPDVSMTCSYTSCTLSLKCHLFSKAFSRYPVFLLCLIIPVLLPHIILLLSGCFCKFLFILLIHVPG